MTFVNEYMSAEDIKKYDIEALDTKYNHAHYKSEWTVEFR